MTKVLNKQPNARECFVCGWENDMGLHARFYEVENNELVATFTPDPMHQGFPGRFPPTTFRTGFLPECPLFPPDLHGYIH